MTKLKLQKQHPCLQPSELSHIHKNKWLNTPIWLCLYLIYTIPFSWDISLLLSICPSELMTYSDKVIQFHNTTSVLFTCFNMFKKKVGGGRQNVLFFSFFLRFCAGAEWRQASITFWQETKEGWAGPKRQDQFQSSWSHDPRTQRESLRESQLSVPRLGDFEVGSERLGGWSSEG